MEHGQIQVVHPEMEPVQAEEEMLEVDVEEFDLPESEEERALDEAEAAEEKYYTNYLEHFSDDEADLLDTTAEQVVAGKDIQGIPWSTTPWTRHAYREKRNADYTSYYNREAEVKAAEAAIIASALRPRVLEPPNTRYHFYRNWRKVRPTIVHFQLRNLVWPTSAHEVYYVSNNSVLRWNNLQRTAPDVVLDVSSASDARRYGTSLDAINVCTLCARHGIVAAGGFGGELVIRRWDGGPAASLRVTNSDNGITNAIDIYNGASGPLRLACSNNDQAVRLFDAEGLAPAGTFRLPWAVNCCVASPSGKILCAVGDDPDGVLLDPASGTKIARLTGHYDYSFAAAWHPDGNIVATGNQDLTTRIFDLRMTSRVLCTLRAHIGAVRSLRFSPDGRTLAVAEPADYVTLYDVASNYSICETIDLFGELAGIGFSPASERLFIAVSDVHYASLVQMNRATGRDLVAQWQSINGHH